jgi:hypothetical protein
LDVIPVNDHIIGIWVRNSDRAQIGDVSSAARRNNITGNGLDPGDADDAGIRISGDSDNVVINRNNIQGNIDFGLWNSSGNAVDAQFNWWGAPDGAGPPAGTGSGDSVQNTGASTTDISNPLGSPIP